MAKYTDPNTGVKYSTHTGLKVFTVIAVILLVISIVFNVVLYFQNSDVTELETGESGELGDDYGGGENTDENPSEDGENTDENPSEDGDDSDLFEDEGSVLPPVDEDVVNVETVIENENVVMASDFNEYGVAKCLYYGFDYPAEAEMYITKGGSVYFEPIAVSTQTLVDEDGSTDINSEIRASLVFRVEYSDVKYEDYYYNTSPKYIEIVSLTGEPLEIESVELKQHVYYVTTDKGSYATCTGYRSENGLEIELSEDSDYGICPDVTTIYDRGSLYGTDGSSGQFVFYITLADGNKYSFEYWVIGNTYLMLGANLETVA